MPRPRAQRGDQARKLGGRGGAGLEVDWGKRKKRGAEPQHFFRAVEFSRAMQPLRCDRKKKQPTGKERAVELPLESCCEGAVR